MRTLHWFILLLCSICLILILFRTTESFENQDPLVGIDVVYYINLDHRTDRKEALLENLKEYGIPERKIQRIDAVLNKENGALGCTLSHIKTYETFMKSNYKTCIILEDDFMFYGPKEIVQQRFNDLQTIPYDVFLVAANTKAHTFKTQESKYTHFQKVLNAQTTAGYVLTKAFCPRLLANVKEGSERLMNDPENRSDYAIDQYWKLLQPIANWYITSPTLGKQRPSYSDIENAIVDYNV